MTARRAFSLLRKLDQEALSLYATALQHIYFRCGVLPEGELLAGFYNLSFDALDEIGHKVKKVELLQPEGTWSEAVSRQESDALRIGKSTACQEFEILKIMK